MSWETGEGKSYLIPALEVGGFLLGLNLFDRLFIDSEEYGSDLQSIWDNLTGPRVIDNDPFSINQLGHPYQGSIYYGSARSAGLNYWQSLLYTLAGSVVWEIAGETTPPSLNDHIATGIGGTFIGESLFRMASLLLEGGGARPGFWRELGAALISPPTGFNRLVFGERFRAVFPSRDPAIFVRLSLGATFTTDVDNAGLPDDVDELDASVGFTMTYGLPGKPGYRYKRPFDYFHFELALVPTADGFSNVFENVSIRGLLLGTNYEWGETYRGLWGLFGDFEYLSPQIFRLSTTALALGTVAQWWLSRTVALQGATHLGIGFAASGTVADEEERDYHYGVAPQGLLGLRLIFGDRAMLEASGRQYWVSGAGSGAGSEADHPGNELITRANTGFTLRVYGPHALGIQYTISTRDTRPDDLPDRHQSVQTVGLSYTFLGQTRFGAVEWRPRETGSGLARRAP